MKQTTDVNNRNVLEKYEAQYGRKPQLAVDADELKDLLEHQEFKMKGVHYENPDNERMADQLNESGISLLEAGHLKEAILKLKQATKLDPGNPYILVNLARCYLDAKVYELAIDYCQKALALEPHNEWVKQYLKYAIFMYEQRAHDIFKKEFAMGEFNNVAERTVAALIDMGLFLLVFVVFRIYLGKAALGVTLFAVVLYWMFMETIYQASLGKMMMKIKIIRLDGEKLRFGDVLKRLVTRLLGDNFLLAFWACLYTPRHQRVGDLWARTAVVRVGQEKRPYHFDFNV